MGWNGSGTFTATDGTYSSPGICESQAGDGDAKIKASEMDAVLDDLNDGINACLAKNGENAATANLSMGGYRLTNVTASGNTDAGTYGKQVASGAYNSGTDTIVLTLNDASTISIDTSSLSAGTGGVDLTTNQEIAGDKAFASLRIDGQTKTQVATPTPGASVTIDTTANDVHYVTIGVNTTIDFTWPTGATDSQLGANWCKRGHILCRWTGAGYTASIGSTTTSALDDYSTEGSPATGSGDISTLVYNYYYLNGTEYAQFAWVATP